MGGTAVKEAAFCFLSALVMHGGEADAAQISEASGYAFERYQVVSNKMIANCLLRKPWAGRWQITERGKIALAIETGRRTKRRLLGVVASATVPKRAKFAYGAKGYPL